MALARLWLLPILLACSGDSDSNSESNSVPDSRSTEALICPTVDYSICGGPLPATQNDGQPWPTFSEALATALNCVDGRRAESPWAPYVRGVCADGKQFITRHGGYVGLTSYFDGETLVGRASYTDISGTECACSSSSFAGTLETVRCDTPTFEALCDTALPDSLDVPFANGTTYCSCDEQF